MDPGYLGFTRQPTLQNQQASDPNKRSYIKKQGGTGDLCLREVIVLSENVSLVPITHIGWVTTDFNSSS